VAVLVVQVTAGISHSLKLNYVESLLEPVVMQGLQVASVDVVSVVPRAITFQVVAISGPGKTLRLATWERAQLSESGRVVTKLCVATL
jgi:hypothetical protein